MKLNEVLQKKPSNKFEPSALLEMRFKNYDLASKTDEEGNAIILLSSIKMNSAA